MPGDTVQIGSDNAIRIGSDDKIKVAGAADPCCCTPATDPACGFCNNGTVPSSITLDLSGLSLCSSCNSTVLFWKFTGNDINGTYDLANTFSCVYQAILSGAWQAQRYTTSACTTTFGSPQNFDTVRFNVAFVSGGILITIKGEGVGSNEMFFFSSAISGLGNPFDCSVERTDGNEFTCSYVSAPDAIHGATGGSVTLTMNP